jgi:DDE superfamily endonuclease
MAIKVLFFLFTADSAYEISSSCMKPFINARSRQQKTFNRKLSGIRTRCTEDLIGIMKRRFPILAQGIQTKLPTAFDIIVACGVLHNLAVFLREPKVDDEVPPLILTGSLQKTQLPLHFVKQAASKETTSVNNTAPNAVPVCI